MSNGPEDFVSFADYLGLNEEAGQQMAERAMSGGGKLRSAAMAASDANYNASREAGEGATGGAEAYGRTGEQMRTGLASYSDFMRGMSDPGERQSMMAKAYGGANVSRFDSALAGAAGGSQIAAGQKDAQSLRTQFESRGMDADARRGRYASQTAAQSAEDARGLAARQADANRREKDRLGKKRALEDFDTDPGQVMPQGLGQREREMYIWKMAKNRKASRADGSVDWDAYYAEGAKRRAAAWAPHAETKNSFGYIDFGKGPKDPAGDESWADYQKRQGAK